MYRQWKQRFLYISVEPAEPPSGTKIFSLWKNPCKSSDLPSVPPAGDTHVLHYDDHTSNTGCIPKLFSVPEKALVCPNT